jgi:hypothetical protein
MSEANKTQESDGRKTLYGLGTAGCAIIVAAVTFYCVHWADADGDLTKLGSLGDALGPTAAMLNAIALFAAILSVHLQGKELRLQRKEMEENREVMKEQAKHAEELTKAQNRLASAQEDANITAVNSQRVQISLEIMRASQTRDRLSVDTAHVASDQLGKAKDAQKMIDSQIRTLQDMYEGLERFGRLRSEDGTFSEAQDE